MRFLGMFFLLFSSLLGAQPITVSGISSGAYMAQQFHMAYSSVVSGSGIVAGGPYFCAKNQITDALNRCMKTSMGLPHVSQSVGEARRAERAGEIDSLGNLLDAKVFVLAGTQDQTVLPAVGEVLVTSFAELGIPAKNIRFLKDLKVGHAFPTESFGNACPTASQTPYMSSCGRDIAGEILEHLAGPLVPKRIQSSSSFKSYEQLAFVGIDEEERANISLAKTGYAYVPKDCQSGACPIHVAFHGCQQTYADIKDTFIKNAGYNSWAESNRMIILYPQAVKSYVPNNPNGCWDWWGYTGPKYHTKLGAQMRVIMKNIEDIQSGKLKFLPTL